MHDLKRHVEPGHGSWIVCRVCGITKHSGFWWFAGRKSKIEPPCSNDMDWRSEWLKSAINDYDDGFDGGGACGAHD
jgi:hypothetical protein